MLVSAGFPGTHQIRSRCISSSKTLNVVPTIGPYVPGDDGCFSRVENYRARGIVATNEKSFHGTSRRVGQTDGQTERTRSETGSDTGTAANRRRRRGNQRHGAAAQEPRRLVRFKIVGPLLIQADIIEGVCYLHTLVRSAPRTRSYNEEEHGKPLRAILGVDRRCYRRRTACTQRAPSSSVLPFLLAYFLTLFLSCVYIYIYMFFYPAPIFPVSI